MSSPCRALSPILILLAGSSLGCVNPAVATARAFIADHEAHARPLEKALAIAWWNANTSGKDEHFKAKEEAQNRLDALFADPERFKWLEKIRLDNWGDRFHPQYLLRRQIELLYLQHLEKQVDPALLRKLTAKANAIEKAFNVYRAKVGGKELTDSEVRKVLKGSKDSKERQAVWDASKGVGAAVEADLRELVRLRNQAARRLQYVDLSDYHKLQLFLNEQHQENVLKLFDELYELTREAFLAAKAEIDAKLAKDYGIPVADLRPWHYHDPFFQEPPSIYDFDIDAAYKDVDILKVCRDFYAGIGLPIDDVIARSDLYEKPGKSPHAFCTDIDRDGDVRVLANIVPNEYWMGTMLHELGHAVYSSKNIPASVPYLLRAEAHILATEGVAMMFEPFSKSADWLASAGVKVPDPAAFNATGAKLRRNRLLIFAAWAQVMFRFEMAMYANPEQDLSRLWWDLVEKYQGLKRPDGRNAPDYGSKIHVVSAPCYYHNYLLGQLFASQVHHTIAREVLKTDPTKALYTGHPEVGEFLRKRVFGPGRRYRWDELTRFATGEDLNAKAFAEDLKR